MTSNKTRLAIVDQSLRDLNGHHYEYDLGVARAASALGVTPFVAAHADCDPAIGGEDLTIRPHFARAWNEPHQGKLNRAARHVLASLPSGMRMLALDIGSGALQRVKAIARVRAASTVLPDFGKEVVALLAKVELAATDHVLIHTLSIPELHSLIKTLSAAPALPTIHIVLRRDADEPHMRNDPWGGVAGVFESLAANAGLRPSIRFYSDTIDLCEQYRAIGRDISVQLLPIPHLLSSCEFRRQPGRVGPAVFTYLGNARTEKGFHFLPNLAAAMAGSQFASGRVRFVIQANSSMSLEDGVIEKARRRLRAFPKDQVELLEKPLSTGEFYARLVEADILLLPYDASAYRRRSSGILVQAIVGGKPAIVPDGTWMSRSAPPGTVVAFEGYEDLLRASRHALETLPLLTNAASTFAPQWGNFHNSRRLVQFLLETGLPQS